MAQNTRHLTLAASLLALACLLQAGASLCWGAPDYPSLAAAVDPGRMLGDVSRLSALGSRVSGYPGNAKAAEMVLAEFRRLGLETLVQEYDLPAPVDRGAYLELEGRQYPLAAMWPNLVRTSQVPREGITGPLIYVGRGDLSDYNGKQVAGSIALMDFNTGQRWLNAPLLDAAAVVFVEPERTSRGEAEMKFVQCPVDVPRFYLKADLADELLARMERGVRREARLGARMAWENAANRNVIGILPGSDPDLRDEAVVLQAYYDSISVAPALAPGAENAAGIAALLELARGLKRNPPARSVIFLATSGHFQALAGMREFVRLWGREPRNKGLPHPPAPSPSRNDRSGEGENGKGNDLRARLDEFSRAPLFISLDLSTQNGTVGVFQSGWYYAQAHLARFYSPLGKQFSDYATGACEALGLSADDVFVDGINPVRGREWHTWFPGRIAFDSEMAIRGGRPGVTFATVADARSWVDTPLDTPDRINAENLTAQVRLLACLLRGFLDDCTLDSGALKRVNALKKLDELKDARGSVLEFRRRESFVPNTPVPGALVLVQGQYRMMMGVHTEVLGMADGRGEFVLRGEGAAGGMLEAYAFDGNTGAIRYAPDRGSDGDRRYPRDVLGRAGLKRPVIVFGCAPTDLFDLVDERYFQTLQKLMVFDAKDNSEPLTFGYSLSSAQGGAAEFPSYVEPCGVVYSDPKADLQVAMGMGLLGVRMVLCNATAERPEGVGFRAGETPRIALTPLRAARDMWRLDEYRMGKLRNNGIENARLRDLHEMAQVSLATADEALRGRRYDVALSAARHAWGYESRAYPEVQQTAADVVKGLLFYLALLLPFSYFGERLLLAGRNVLQQILGTVGVFVVVFGLIALVHPAFSLTTAPPVILLSFVIMALAVLVIAIVTAKFNTELKAMKQQRGGVHEADVGRLSAAGAAFALGIANMRRRKLRTALTAITLTLLTFTVLSFTSVKSYIRANKVKLSHAPAYPGVLLRDRAWLPLEQPTADIIANEFAGAATVSPRAWYTSADVSKELAVDVALTGDPSKRGSASCLLGLTAQEREVLPVARLLAAGKWLPDGARNVALLPTSLARVLGIGEADLGTATVTLFGAEFRVIGLLDEARMRGLQDLDGEPLTPVNYAMLRPELLKELELQAQQRAQLGTSTAGSLLQEYKHFSPERVVILPYDRVLELGGTLRSVAVRYGGAGEAGRSVEAMLKRFALSLYCGIGRETYLFSSAGMTSLKGLEGLVIPILIAALIVLNTMLGSVYERTKEIGIYSSLGLAPSHIGALFLAEATVFANLGAIMGYLTGQGLARVLFITGHTGGLELNYSSTSAVGVTVVVVLTVLISTLYPSRRASDIASPAVERRWALPEPQGDLMDIRLPFTVTGRDALGVCAFLREFFEEYVGYAGGEFLAEDVRLSRGADVRASGGSPEGKPTVAVDLRMWLAPYDLGVSQDFGLECRLTEDGDIHEVHIRLARLAGDVASWKKANALFMSNIRKQFLLWRTVPQGEKEAYADLAARGE